MLQVIDAVAPGAVRVYPSEVDELRLVRVLRDLCDGMAHRHVLDGGVGLPWGKIDACKRESADCGLSFGE